jgi:hypothetical protein
VKDDTDLLDEYSRIMELDPMNDYMAKCRCPHVRDVDWGAVHRLEEVAPVRVAAPRDAATLASIHATRWRDSVLENFPDYVGDYRHYLFIYADGDDCFERDSYQQGAARFRWVDPSLMVMGLLNAEVAAVYKARDMNHEILVRVWGRHVDVTSKVPRRSYVEWMSQRTVSVKVVDPEARDEDENDGGALVH